MQLFSEALRLEGPRGRSVLCVWRCGRQGGEDDKTGGDDVALAPSTLNLSPLLLSLSLALILMLLLHRHDHLDRSSLPLFLSNCRRSALLAYAMHSAAAATKWSCWWRILYQTSTATVACCWTPASTPANLWTDATFCTSPGIIKQRHPLVI